MAIQQPIEDIEKVEQKLLSFSQQITQSSGILDNLSAIQVQFEDLAKTYESFKQNSAKLKQKNQRFEVFKVDAEQRLEDIEKMLQNMQTAFSSLQQDWENPRETVEIYLDNMETRLRTELRGALSQLEQPGLTQAQLDKLEKLDTQVRALRTTIRTTERRSRILQNWLVVTSLVALMSLGMQLFTPLMRAKQPTQATSTPELPKEKSSSASPESEPDAAAIAEEESAIPPDFSSTIGQ